MSTSSLKTQVLRRISKIVDNALEETEVFKRAVDKTELMETCSRLMDYKISPEELLSISEDELAQRIEQMMAGRALGGLLDDLTPEQIKVFNAAVEVNRV